jgi:hypothetical protein
LRLTCGAENKKAGHSRRFLANEEIGPAAADGANQSWVR